MSDELLDIDYFNQGQETSLTEDCVNYGCGFNNDGKCTASGTECFGYINKESQTHQTR